MKIRITHKTLPKMEVEVSESSIQEYLERLRGAKEGDLVMLTLLSAVKFEEIISIMEVK